MHNSVCSVDSLLPHNGSYGSSVSMHSALQRRAERSKCSWHDEKLNPERLDEQGTLSIRPDKKGLGAGGLGCAGACAETTARLCACCEAALASEGALCPDDHSLGAALPLLVPVDSLPFTEAVPPSAEPVCCCERCCWWLDCLGAAGLEPRSPKVVPGLWLADRRLRQIVPRQAALGSWLDPTAEPASHFSSEMCLDNQTSTTTSMVRDCVRGTEQQRRLKTASKGFTSRRVTTAGLPESRICNLVSVL